MAQKEMISVVYSFYDALMKGDIEKMFILYAENVTLDWGPFTFRGKDEIKQWAIDLRQMFIDLKVIEIELLVQENEVTHNIIMAVTAPNGRKASMLGVANYEFKDGKIQHININLLKGTILVNKEELS